MSNIESIKIFCVLGFFFVGVLGTVSHFFYEWSNYKKIVGIFFPANESTWEHLKLAIFPTLIYFIFGLLFINNSNYVFALFITLLISMILIPAIFYTYTSITKQPILAVDILTYYFSIFVAWLCCFYILNHQALPSYINIVAIAGISIIIICYLTFTIKPPQKFLFKDPRGFYGLQKNNACCFS